jgi:hypothetical protein
MVVVVLNRIRILDEDFNPAVVLSIIGCCLEISFIALVPYFWVGHFVIA